MIFVTVLAAYTLFLHERLAFDVSASLRLLPCIIFSRNHDETTTPYCTVKFLRDPLCCSRRGHGTPMTGSHRHPTARWLQDCSLADRNDVCLATVDVTTPRTLQQEDALKDGDGGLGSATTLVRRTADLAVEVATLARQVIASQEYD